MTRFRARDISDGEIRQLNELGPVEAVPHFFDVDKDSRSYYNEIR